MISHSLNGGIAMMRHVPDIRRLGELLEAECAGLPFDRCQARELACHLAEACPEICNSLRRISERMTERPH